MKKIFLLIFCLTALSAGCNKTETPIPSSYNRTMEVGNKKISIEVAATLSQKKTGLSYRSSMPQTAGMLFDFSTDTDKQPAFWMKDMHFPLDLIWIKDGKIISITKNVPNPAAGTPDNQLALYYPPSDIDHTLEVNGGWSEKNNVKIGDEIKY